MEQVTFKDYIKPNMGQQKYASEIKTLSLKQLSRGNFTIKDECIFVEIELFGNRYEVRFDNSLSVQEIMDLAYIASPHEPSLDYLRNKLFGVRNESFLSAMVFFQDNCYLSGDHFNEEIWVKLYSTKPIESAERELYQAGWVDYEKQLKEGNIIFDEKGLVGLFAMPVEQILKCLNEECKEKYGDKLLVLKTVDDCFYINDGKEIIGNRFLVDKKINLDQWEDIKVLYEILLEQKRKIYQEKIDELTSAKREAENESYCIKREIEEYGKAYSKLKRCIWILMLVAFFIGILISKL